MTTTDEERWAQAESILDKNPTPSAAARVRRARATVWLLVVGVMVLGLAVAVLAFVLARHGPHRVVHVPAWQEFTGLGVQVAGMAVEIAGLVILIRRKQWGARWRAPTAVLSRAQRRSLTRQIRGRVPVDPARVPLARDLALRLADQRGSQVLMVGIAIVSVGQTITHPRPFLVGMTVALLVLYAVAIPLARRQSNSARRFLVEHPAEAD